MADAARLKERVRELVEGMVDELVAVSHDLHARPELAWEERYAHGRLTDLAERHGLPVQRSAHGLETAFDIRVGREGPQVAVLCEYDALPGVGHACGHNIIAAAGIRAAIGA